MVQEEQNNYKTQNAVECLLNDEYRDAAFATAEAEEGVGGDSDVSANGGAKQVGRSQVKEEEKINNNKDGNYNQNQL